MSTSKNMAYPSDPGTAPEHAAQGATGNERPESPGNALRSILKLRDFRLFFTGETISLVGDQFYLIALPWLVLLLSGDAIALGTVLAFAAIPRALFMIVGGAVTDRFSPRTVMIASNVGRLLLVSLLTGLVFTASIEVWMLYLFALAFGFTDAFFYPAQMAIVPLLVEKRRLQVANALVMGITQVSMFAGPVLAGLVIATFATSQTDLTGIGYAFGIDALTFLASVISLTLMSVTNTAREKAKSMVQSIRSGLAYAWRDRPLRTIILVVIAVNFFIVGPLMVGIPYIAAVRLAKDATAFGTIMTAFGGGALLGIVLGGGLPRPKSVHFGSLLLIIIGSMGVGVLSFAFLSTIAWLAVSALSMGVANGYVNVIGITWIQARIEQRMMGRIMSVVMFASTGIAPISLAFSGFLIDWNMEVMFIAMGAALMIFAAVMAPTPQVKQLHFDSEAVSSKSEPKSAGHREKVHAPISSIQTKQINP